MAINTTAIASTLRPGLAAIFGDYPMYPSQWSEIFEVYDSDKATEIEQEMKFLGLGQIMAEGAPVPVDSMGQRATTLYTHKYVGLSFTITRQAIMDNLYKTKFPMMVKSLKKSMAQTKEVLGASVLNNGFNAAFPIGDGQPLFSLNHPIDGGVQANTPAVGADLTEGSLEQGDIAISGFKDAAGLIVQTRSKKLIVSRQNTHTANRLLKSEFRTNTANNDISSIYNLETVREGCRVNQFLTSASAWFLLSDAPDSFKHYVREEIETDVYTDFSTKNLMASAMERYSFGVSNWRGAWGNPGT